MHTLYVFSVIRCCTKILIRLDNYMLLYSIGCCPNIRFSSTQRIRFIGQKRTNIFWYILCKENRMFGQGTQHTFLFSCIFVQKFSFAWIFSWCNMEHFVVWTFGYCQNKSFVCFCPRKRIRFLVRTLQTKSECGTTQTVQHHINIQRNENFCTTTHQSKKPCKTTQRTYKTAHCV